MLPNCVSRIVSVGFIAACGLHAAPRPDLSISASVNGAKLTIRTSARTAGAIDSIVWRGKEFLNSYDHGRELQSASSFDGYGECLNPTEAGSDKDGPGPMSSSQFVSGKARGRVLETTIEMAYWMPPGTPYPRACGSHSDFRQAKNDAVRSKDLLTKRVQIGIPAAPNAISYDIAFATAQDYQSATFEALTAYLSPEFSEFFTWNPATGSLDPLSDGPGEQPLPVILTTPDHRFAMGVYSPSLPQNAHPASGYGRWRFMQNPKIVNWNTVKWNAVFREAPVPHGRYHYLCYVSVGTLDDVRHTFSQLRATR